MRKLNERGEKRREWALLRDVDEAGMIGLEVLCTCSVFRVFRNFHIAAMNAKSVKGKWRAEIKGWTGEMLGRLDQKNYIENNRKVIQ